MVDVDGVVLDDGRTDAATDVELARLRRRAYGREGDIGSDPRALRRLIELEDAVVRERAAEASGVVAPRITHSTGDDASGSERDVTDPEPDLRDDTGSEASRSVLDEPPASAPPSITDGGESPPTSRRRPSRRTVLIAACAATVVALGLGTLGVVRAVSGPDYPPLVRTTPAPAVLDARKAYSFAWDTDAVTLLNIPLDGSFGTYIDLPTSGVIPEFPSTGTVQWVADLGRYFGWEVWIAGASVGETGLQREHCILIQRNDMVRSRCVPAAVRAQSALLVSVSFASVDPEERPVGMGDDQRLGFWWRHDRSVSVIVGDEP